MSDAGTDVIKIEEPPQVSGEPDAGKDQSSESDKKKGRPNYNKKHHNKKQQHKKWKKGGKFKRRKNNQAAKGGGGGEINQPAEGQSKPSSSNSNCQNRKHGHCHAKAPPYGNVGQRNKRIQQAFSTVSKFFLPDKLPRKARVIPPTKFLLGGNISDPLNLNSLQNESENAVTPKSSPVQTTPGRQPVEVLIPPNIHDPLHLLDPVDSVEYEMQLCSPMKRTTNATKHKPRHRKRRKSCKENTLDSNTSVNVSTKSDPGQIQTNTKLDPSDASFGKTIEGDVPSTSSEIPEPERAVKNLRLELCEPGTGRKRRCSESSTSGKGKQRRVDMDKIVSPVIPQSYPNWKRPHKNSSKPTRNRTKSFSRSISEEQSTTNRADDDQLKMDENAQSHLANDFEDINTNDANLDIVEYDSSQKETTQSVMKISKNSRYQFGNYDRYYGYRHLNEFMDVRLKVFLKNTHFFKDKDILDIGCNVGLLTIWIGKVLQPKSIVGVDIDEKLINRARKNLTMYVRVPAEINAIPSTSKDQSGNNQRKRRISRRYSRRNSRYDKQTQESQVDAKFFPISFPICLGRIPNIQKPLKEKEETTIEEEIVAQFPDNVSFKLFNYVPKDENQLLNETQQYDLILCLSVTKWIHLNFGDAGLKMVFKRMFNQLRPGGKLILEAQNWASYKKKKNVSETVKKNYKSIRFFPKKFNEYLLSSEVGFSHSYPLGIPRHLSKGFSRPIQV